MKRRVKVAAAGAAATAALLSVVLAASPVRPEGLVTGLVIVGVLVPLATLVGVGSALGVTDQPDLRSCARLGALGAPIMVIMLLFLLQVVFGDRATGSQQLVAVVLGVTTSAAMAARFTGFDIDD